MPDVYMIGGANGSGKTTIAMTLLPRFLKIYEFVNADEIARGLNPIKPDTANIAAGRIMIQRIADLTDAKKDFAFETTCAGQHHAQTLQACKAAGYRINFIFLWLPSPEIAIERVKQRVAQGGHDIPQETIRRRYAAGVKNAINLYMPMADDVLCIDRTTVDLSNLKIVAEKNNKSDLIIYDNVIWSKMNEVAHGK